MDTYYQVTVASYLSFFRESKKLVELVEFPNSLTFFHIVEEFSELRIFAQFPFSEVGDYFNNISV